MSGRETALVSWMEIVVVLVLVLGGSDSLVLEWGFSGGIGKGDGISVRVRTTLSGWAVVSGCMVEGVSFVGEGVGGGAPCVGGVVEKWPH